MPARICLGVRGAGRLGRGGVAGRRGTGGSFGGGAGGIPSSTKGSSLLWLIIEQVGRSLCLLCKLNASGNGDTHKAGPVTAV